MSKQDSAHIEVLVGRLIVLIILVVLGIPHPQR